MRTFYFLLLVFTYTGVTVKTKIEWPNGGVDLSTNFDF